MWPARCLLLVCSIFLALACPARSEEKIDPSKIGDKIAIRPGEKIFVQFDQEGDKLKNPRRTDATGDPAGVSLEFKADNLPVDGKNETLFFLHLHSHLKKTFLCRAAIRLRGKKHFFETSILPLPEGFQNTESWQDPIEEMILFDFKLSAEKDPQ